MIGPVFFLLPQKENVFFKSTFKRWFQVRETSAIVEEPFTIEVREKLHMGLWLTIKDLLLPNPLRDTALMKSGRVINALSFDWV